MNTVKLEVTENRRRLHIGSIFVDLNESEYQELVKVFSSQPNGINTLVSGSCCPLCKESIQWYPDDDGKEGYCRVCDKWATIVR